MHQVTVYDYFDGSEVENYFGVCPKCDKCNGYINIGAWHWFYCKEHKLCWCVGANLFSDWRYETDEEQERIFNELGFDSFEECNPTEAWEAARALYEARVNRSPFSEAELNCFAQEELCM